jgi:hypothetical protein
VESGAQPCEPSPNHVGDVTPIPIPVSLPAFSTAVSCWMEQADVITSFAKAPLSSRSGLCAQAQIVGALSILKTLTDNVANTTCLVASCP